MLLWRRTDLRDPASRRYTQMGHRQRLKRQRPFRYSGGFLHFLHMEQTRPCVWGLSTSWDPYPVCGYWSWNVGDTVCLNSGTWCCYGLHSTALGSHNNYYMLARLRRRGEEYQPKLRAARTRLAATKARSTASIIKADAGYICPVSLRSICSVAGRASVGWRPCIVISSSWV